MGRYFPPRPTARGIEDYEIALVRRFRPGAFEVAQAATESAAVARALAGTFTAALDALDRSHPERPTLQAHVDRLNKAADAADTVAKTWDTDYRPSEEAAAFVRSSVDLQVAKAGGLLAFVAIAAAIAVVIWPARVPPWRFVPTITFWSLAAGSLLSLAAIWAHWGPDSNYTTPQADLAASLRFAAVRSWIGNGATAASIIAAAAIAWWVAAGSVPQVPLAPQALLPDSILVRCGARDAVRARPAHLDSLACVVRR